MMEPGLAGQRNLKKYADSLFRWRNEKNILADINIHTDTGYHFFKGITFKKYNHLKRVGAAECPERIYYYEKLPKNYSVLNIWREVFK